MRIGGSIADLRLHRTELRSRGGIWRSASLWRVLGEVLLWSCLVVAIRARVMGASFSSDWDESVYVLTADAWLHGGLPYVTVWDQHPIGVPAMIAVAGWFTGDTLVAARWGVRSCNGDRGVGRHAVHIS